VQRQVIGPRERSVAQPTLERPVAGVLAEVPGQLVGPGELPSASVPVALVRFFAGVRAQVRLQVRALGVRLSASRVAARVVGRRLFGPLRPPFADRAARPPRRPLPRHLCGRRGHGHFHAVFGRRRRRRHHGRRVRRGHGRSGGHGRSSRGRRLFVRTTDHRRRRVAGRQQRRSRCGRRSGRRRRRGRHQLAHQELGFRDRVSAVAVVRRAGRRRYLLLLLLDLLQLQLQLLLL